MFVTRSDVERKRQSRVVYTWRKCETDAVFDFNTSDGAAIDDQFGVSDNGSVADDLKPQPNRLLCASGCAEDNR
jgi:hypothetical protein